MMYPGYHNSVDFLGEKYLMGIKVVGYKLKKFVSR